MNKVKYLHRRARKGEYYSWETKKHKRDNMLDLFSPLPYKQSIRKNCREFRNFDSTPLYEFIYSKIGENWDDVYSEIIKKVKPKYRKDIEYDIRYHIKEVIYDDRYIPRSPYGNVLSNKLYVDFNNIVCYKDMQEIMIDSKKMIRYQKLKELMENQEIENKKIQSED